MSGGRAAIHGRVKRSTPCHPERRPKELCDRGQVEGPLRYIVRPCRFREFSRKSQASNAGDVSIAIQPLEKFPIIFVLITVPHLWPRNSLLVRNKCQGTTLASCPSRAQRARAAQSCRKTRRKASSLRRRLARSEAERAKLAPWARNELVQTGRSGSEWTRYLALAGRHSGVNAQELSLSH